MPNGHFIPHQLGPVGSSSINFVISGGSALHWRRAFDQVHMIKNLTASSVSEAISTRYRRHSPPS